MNQTLVALFVQAKIHAGDFQGIIDFILSPLPQQIAILTQVGNDKLVALNTDLATAQTLTTNTTNQILAIQNTLKP